MKHHTPGPWVADTVNRWPEQIGCCPLVGRPYSIGHKFINVAAASSPEDARLIGAAPDLLQFVLDFVGHMDSVAAKGGHTLAVTLNCGLVRDARAAIAKATGETQ